MTSDIDLGVDLDELAAEEARSNRPTWNQEPIQWEGDLAVIDMGQDVNEKTGQVFPKHAFHFIKCKFLDVGNASWLEDGNEYTLLISPVSDEQKAKKTSRFTAIGKSTLASGQNLTKFLHQRVRVTELAETYKSREGYDRQSYHWKFEALTGTTANGSKPAVEIPAALIDQVLAFIAAGSYTSADVAGAVFKSDLMDVKQCMPLVDKLANGKFVSEMIEAGRIFTSEQGVLLVVNLGTPAA